jgi:hypothetical protein
MSAREIKPLTRQLRKQINRALAAVIRRRRLRLHLSLNQLAAKSGVSHPMLGYVKLLDVTNGLCKIAL